MKAADLRIGNYVKDKYENNIYQISSGVKINNAHLYEPIELTEEWLLKIGFQKKLDTFYIHELGLSWLTTEDNFQTEIKLADSKWFLIDLKFVHQLQNFYFAVFGEELIIK